MLHRHAPRLKEQYLAQLPDGGFTDVAVELPRTAVSGERDEIRGSN